MLTNAVHVHLSRHESGVPDAAAATVSAEQLPTRQRLRRAWQRRTRQHAPVPVVACRNGRLRLAGPQGSGVGALCRNWPQTLFVGRKVLQNGGPLCRTLVGSRDSACGKAAFGWLNHGSRTLVENARPHERGLRTIVRFIHVQNDENTD